MRTPQTQTPLASIRAGSRRKIRQFARAEDGNMFALFALALVAMLAAVGLAVDGSRGFTVRTELRAALDAAGLALAREFNSQVSTLVSGSLAANASTTETDAHYADLEVWAADYVNEYLAANFDEGFFSSSTVTSDTTVVQILLDDSETPGEVQLRATTTMPTYLLGLVEVSEINVTVEGTYTIGGGGGTAEVALVLDSSGSVAWADVRGSLIAATAAMMDELIPCDSGATGCTNDDVHVSLIPFRAHSRLPDASYVDSWNVRGTTNPRGACIDPRYSEITDANNNNIHDLFETIDLCSDETTGRNAGDECILGREHGYFDWFLQTISTADHSGFRTHYEQIRTNDNVAVFPDLSTDFPTAQGDLDPPVWPAAALDYFYVSHLDDAPPVVTLPSTDSGYDVSGTNTVARFRGYNGYLGGYDESDFNTYEAEYQDLRYRPSSDSTYRHDHNGDTCADNEMVGPTNSRDDIQNEVDQWVTYGGTSMDVGMAWGWRAVSPRWRGYWGLTDIPRDYDSPGNTKAVVLVTDSIAAQVARNIGGSCPVGTVSGGYEELYGYEDETNRRGVYCSDEYPYNDSGTVTDFEWMSRYTQYRRHEINMLLVCEQMRAVGIEVTVVYLLANAASTGSDYAEMVELQTESQPVYEACATQSDDPHARAGQDYFFAVSTQDELADVFAAIGQSLSSLRVAN